MKRLWQMLLLRLAFDGYDMTFVGSYMERDILVSP
jgi:hypothetical protein